MKIGYARVSTRDQNLDLQIDALKEAGCQKIFQDKSSGTRASRPDLDKMLGQLRPGDTVVVYKLDRLGRSMPHLVKMINEFKEQGIHFQSIRDGIVMDDSAVGNMIINIFSSFAQFERDLISERTRAGLRAARKRGRLGGRPPGLSDDAKKTAAAAKFYYESGEYTVRQACRKLGVSSATYYKYLRHVGVDIQ